MKFRVTFKDSNINSPVVYGAAINAKDDVWKKFVEYDEYITIEFDSRTGKAKVVPVQSR